MTQTVLIIFFVVVFTIIATEQLKCGPGEVVDDCPVKCPSDRCPKYDGEDRRCAKPKVCGQPKCKCGFNMRRADNGTCIRTKDCPSFPCIKPFTHFVSCPPYCPSDNCSQATPDGRCPIIGRIGIVVECFPTCRCIKGYWKNDGICVPYCECRCVSKQPAASAYSASSSIVSNTAVSSSKRIIRPCRNKKCNKVIKCKENEENVRCIESLSRAQYCSQRDQSLWSAETTKCTQGCVCKEDYLRNDNGICVPEEECESDCDDNEILDQCPADCPTDYCPTRDGESSACFEPDQDECPPPTCKCRFNYRRAFNGTCIPTRDCPPFDCSARPNEEFNPCPPLCPTDDCSQATPSGECPKQFGNILIVLPCEPKCRCKKGYWRKNGICVPYEKCPNICPANEEYSNCTQSLCRKQNCSDRHEPLSCPKVDTNYCKKGCVCKKDFFRNKNGTCVPENACDVEPQPTCGMNEVLVNCSSDCPSDYCPKSEEDNNKKCEKPKTCPPPTCKCRFNYRRAKNGTCIPTTDCPPFDCSAKPNEQYAPCPPLCPSDSCGLPRLKGRCPFRIGIVLECKPKCQCKDGYGRLENGTCVRFEECPDLCPDNEEYNPCTETICRPLNCTNRSERINCPLVKESSCTRDCVCKENYYKNNKGVCVSVADCEAPVCPNPYEEYQSTRIPNCPLLGTCTSIVARIACDKPEVPSCVCKGGYLRLNETSPCIPTCECPQMKNSPECLKDSTSTS